MAKFQSPLLGYNNNVRHRGRIFHIQTEDSGVNHPHIITHLFMDGGRILKSVKKSYAEHVGNDGLSETVRVMMKEQHKAMFIALRDGQFDELVDGQKAHEKAMAAKHAATAAGAVAAAAAAVPAVLPKSESGELLAVTSDVATTTLQDSGSSSEVEVEIEMAEITLPGLEDRVGSGEHNEIVDVVDNNNVVAVNDIAVVPVIDVTLIDSSPDVGAAAAAVVAKASSSGMAAVESRALGVESKIPATKPDPPRSKDLLLDDVVERSGTTEAFSRGFGGATPNESDIAPLTIPESHRPVYPSGSHSSSEEDLPPDLAALLNEEEVPPPPPVPQQGMLPPPRPPPQSTTDPSRQMPDRMAAAANAFVREEDNPNTTREPERRRASASELTLDFDALERDSGAIVSPMYQTTDLPPPPKQLFAKERGTGAYRAIETNDPESERGGGGGAGAVERLSEQRTDQRTDHRVERTDPNPAPRLERLPPSRPQPSSNAPNRPLAPRGSGPPTRSPSTKPASDGRYAPARPAAIFGAAAKHAADSSSSFGDDLVSDKSLDEVILSYLAEDLDPPRRK